MSLGQRGEQLLLAAYAREAVDTEDAGLATEYGQLETLGYVKVNREYSRTSDDALLSAIVVVLTPKGEDEVHSILSRRDQEGTPSR